MGKRGVKIIMLGLIQKLACTHLLVIHPMTPAATLFQVMDTADIVDIPVMDIVAMAPVHPVIPMIVCQD